MLLLASGSPRRSELLDLLGVSYIIESPSIDETPVPGECPERTVRRLAAAKGAAAAALHPDRWVLSADTVVALDDRVLGKPINGPDAVAMLRFLSGRSHQVFTGIALGRQGATPMVEHASATVRFRLLEEREIEAYVATGEPFDKAGAYAVQGVGGAFVDRLDGELSTVVGLTLSVTARLLGQAGIPSVLAR
ncbi:MAG: Maf family protein [Acidimicrobiia bacterium]|nr:Maf family protein [Acidimicrobiia bacterium]